MKKKTILLFVFLLPFLQNLIAQEIERSEFFIKSQTGIEIFVREVLSNNELSNDKPPIVLIHGARVSGVASFDLDIPNGSLAKNIADAGHAVYILDARGYGDSTRPSEMTEPPEDGKPIVRSPEALHDITPLSKK